MACFAFGNEAGDAEITQGPEATGRVETFEESESSLGRHEVDNVPRDRVNSREDAILLGRNLWGDEGRGCGVVEMG